MSHELSHRIKNIFAIIHSLIGLSARRAPESKKFAMDLQERLSALGRAHDFARPHSEISMPVAGETTLHAILREILRPYPAMDEGRLVVTGDDIAIDDRSATPLALIFHELATNASKYGALSSADGLVTISSQSDAGRLSITWVETGGPPVEGIPERTGFGTRLSGVSVENHLAGKITRHWLATGLVVEMTCPETSLRRA
nr:HWE histidine kinase domain-containing protein [Microvirga antarctica]